MSSEAPPSIAPLVPPVAAAGAADPPSAPDGACPITDEFLPPNMKKHVDAKAPVPLRMMAAKSLVPLSPSDMIGALFMLRFDPDAGVRDTATKTAAGLPDRILATALRDEAIKAPVLGWFLELHGAKDAYAEMLILNANTPDEAVAGIAASCTQRVAEIIGQNQLRLLRHEDILRQLCLNPNASGALLDGVCDFAARSGLQMVDVPQMTAARVRLFGPQVLEAPPDPGPTAEEILQEFAGLESEAAPPLEEGRRLSLAQRIMKMNVANKIKLATKGNKEARGLLLRDTNKLVAVAVVRSPRLTDAEVLTISNSKTAIDDVLRIIYGDREWTKIYPVKMALVKNPKVPQAITMKFISTLRESDVKSLAQDKNVPNSVRMTAKRIMDKKTAPKPEK